MSERLTKRDENGNAYYDWGCLNRNHWALGRHVDRLAAYEDSGLSPEEAQELAKAKAEGRLYILPVTSPDRLTAKSIEFWEKETGMELHCAICGSRLQPGDQKDHLWPYFSNHNRCRKCLEEEKKRKPEPIDHGPMNLGTGRLDERGVCRRCLN